MRVIIQRVQHASVSIANDITSNIGAGMLLLLGIASDDTQEDIDYLVKKIIGLRIFNDTAGRINLSVQDVDGDILVVSQFTLHASTKKGNRPSFIAAARPEIAIPLYEAFINTLSLKHNKPVATGTFGADMQISLVNDGPVTIIMDSKNKE